MKIFFASLGYNIQIRSLHDHHHDTEKKSNAVELRKSHSIVLHTWRFFFPVWVAPESPLTELPQQRGSKPSYILRENKRTSWSQAQASQLKPPLEHILLVIRIYKKNCWHCGQRDVRKNCSRNSRFFFWFGHWIRVFAYMIRVRITNSLQRQTADKTPNSCSFIASAFCTQSKTNSRYVRWGSVQIRLYTRDSIAQVLCVLFVRGKRTNTEYAPVQPPVATDGGPSYM